SPAIRPMSRSDAPTVWMVPVATRRRRPHGRRRMARRTRAQAQERTRERVLAAARTEFLERGFRDAKIDVIAERAELTRGAVYSNFPGKRALYLAVLSSEERRAGVEGRPRE